MLTITIGILTVLAVALLLIHLDSDNPFAEADDHAKRQARLRKILGGAK